MPSLFIFIPLAGVIILNLIRSKKSSWKSAFYTAVSILLLQIIMSLTMGGHIYLKIESILDTKNIISLSSNAYSPLMLSIIGLIALISLYLSKYSKGINLFNYSCLILLVVMGMDGVVMVDDLFSLYVFLEITAVVTFILIAVQKDGDAFQSSFKYLVMSAAATVFILSAIALIFMTVGSLRFDDIGKYISSINGKIPLPVLSSCILLLTGLFIKGGLVPFHGWLPDAYTYAPSSVSILVAGVETKIAGVYSLLIVYTKVFNKNPLMGSIIMIFGTLSIVIGALASIGQEDFKNMLAYSSISQIGYILLAIGIGTPLALFGGVFHFFNHAIFKSLLYVNSAAVEAQTGTTKFKKLGGLASRMPVTGGTSIVGFLSTAGIPPLSGFWSKFIIIAAAWQAGFHACSIIALLSSILTLAYFLKLQRQVFFGELALGLDNITEANMGFKCISILLSAITIIAGVLFPFIAGSL